MILNVDISYQDIYYSIIVSILTYYNISYMICHIILITCYVIFVMKKASVVVLRLPGPLEHHVVGALHEEEVVLQRETPRLPGDPRLLGGGESLRGSSLEYRIPRLHSPETSQRFPEMSVKHNKPPVRSVSIISIFEFSI